MTTRSELNSGGKVTTLIEKFRLNEPITLSTGIKVKVNIAPGMLMEQATNSVKMPDIPVQTLEDGRKVENPNHPEYLQAKADAFRAQWQAGLDVMIAFVDLCDPMIDGWEKRIAYLSRLGHIDLGSYDLSDELDKEFVYKKYIAFGSDDLEMLAKMNGITEEDRQLAKDTFQS